MKHKLLFQRLLASLMLLAVSTLSQALIFELDGICYYTNSGNDASVTKKTSYGRGYSGSVTIPSSVTYYGLTYKVTSVGSDAFRGCSELTAVTIGNGVNIEYNAFSGCSGLTTVTLGNGATYISSSAFSGCSGLTSINIPNSVLTIGNEAFRDCSNLTSINIPNSVRSIGESAFRDCSGLTSVTLGNGVTGIGDYAFFGCSGLTSVTIPNSVTGIGKYAFSGCSGLTSINIPESVTYISEGLFSSCSGLTSVTIGKGVYSIGASAFFGCTNLMSVTCLCPNVPSTGTSAFYNVPQSEATLTVPVTSIEVYKSAEQWKEFGVINTNESPSGKCGENLTWTFNGSTGVLLIKGTGAMADYTNNNPAPWQEYNRVVKSVSLPKGLTNVSNYAFSGCSRLTSIIIPESVSSIGESAFSGCSGLTSITIPENVTSIGRSAFSGCSGLTSITIPSSVTNIGKYAFSGCSGLISITIPESVTTIGGFAFSGCFGLTSVTIPSSVTSIGDNTFYGCSGLTSITIPNNVTSIGQRAFQGCSGLTSVAIGNGVWSIGHNAFEGCSSLTSFTIGNGVTSIAKGAFEGCANLTKAGFASIESLCKISFATNDSNPLRYAKHLYINGSEVTDVVIPNSVTRIGNYAFSNCSGLTSITISNSVTSIGNYAFNGCFGLTTITIPNSVTSIGGFAFSGCSGLESISVDENNLLYDSRNNCNAIIEKSSNTLIVGCKNATIPNSVTSIDEWAFGGCSGLTSVTIPNSVTSIGDDAFYGCSGLTSVICYAEKVPQTWFDPFNGVPKRFATLYVPSASLEVYKAANLWKEFGQILPINGEPIVIDFADANVKQLCVANWDTSGDGELDKDEAAAVTSLGGVFTNNTTITSFNELVYFTGLTTIDGNAFSGCSGLTSFTIPNSVTSIGNSAFSYCPNLTSISIPNSVKSIGSSVFSHCSGLASISVDANNTEYDSRNNCNAIIQKSSNTLIAGCKNTTIPNGVTSIGFEALAYCSDLTSITIPESVTTIGGRAFASCTGLTSFTIGSGVKLIGNYAFSGCIGLTSLTISESVTEIEHHAFNSCSGLTSVFIPKGVTQIHNGVFAHCSNLASIKVDPDNTAYDSRNDCNAIISGSTLKAGCKNTIIPDGVTEIDKYAFSGCSGLTSVIIPESVTKIENSAFSGCTGLTSLTIPSHVAHIDDYAFSGCSNLKTMTCMAISVPRTTLNPFSSTPIGGAILYVPAESLEVYKAATYWKDFGAIRAIGDVPGTEPLNYYDMEGVEKSLVDRDGWSGKLKSTPNALAVVESEQAEWASQHQNVLVTGADGSYSCADFLLTDLSQGYSSVSETPKTGFFTPVSFNVTGGSYKRQAYAGYNTLCLPFSFKASELSSSANVFTFDSYDAEESKVIFKAVGGTVAAGTPCIVKEKADVVWTVNLSGKTIEAAQPSEDSHMRGTYVTTDTWQGKGYSPRSSDGRFAPLTQYLHPFRACFSVSDLNNVGARGSLSAVFMDEDGVTAIDTLSAADKAADTPKSIYTLSGQRVKEIKRSGLYIVNGKKQYIEVK